MHGYGVACFTAKCRRRAAALPPPSAPLAFYILDVSSPNPPPSNPFSSFISFSLSSSIVVRRSPSSTLLSSFLALLRHPRRGFLSRRYHFVCLSRGGPSRRALPYSRVLRSSRPMHAYIDPHTALAMHMPRCTSPSTVARTSLVGSRPRDDRIRRITTCVFSTSRGEPRSLWRANARADFRAALIALGGRGVSACVDFLVSRRRYLPLVCFVSLAVTGDKRFPPFTISHISRAYQGIYIYVYKAEGRERRVSNRISRAGVTFRCKCAL